MSSAASPHRDTIQYGSFVMLLSLFSRTWPLALLATGGILSAQARPVPKPPSPPATKARPASPAKPTSPEEAPKPTKRPPEAGAVLNREGVWERVFDLAPGVQLALVHVPAGEFQMGSGPTQGYPEERPQHKVVFSRGFWMGKFEVTQAQWQALTGSNPSHFKGADLPVESVTWEACQSYLERLNRKFGRSGEQAFRLPSEAEWEYACRAGTQGNFNFGDDEGALGRHGWFTRNSDNRSHPVGQLRPNAWGLYDMHGNVWEWCEDNWHSDHAGAPGNGAARRNKAGLFGSRKVFRGGAWYVNAHWCRAATRSKMAADTRFGSYGFRVVISGIANP